MRRPIRSCSVSFSKVVVPGFRLGWIVSDALMQKLIIAKQTSGLHSSSFLQEVMLQYLNDNDLDLHIRKLPRPTDARNR